MNDNDIELSQSNVIEIDYDNFTLEYNITKNTWIAIPKDQETYSEVIILEGNIDNDDDISARVYSFNDESKNIFGYIMTKEEFEELKYDIKSL